MNRRGLGVAALCLLCGCNDMAQQPRYARGGPGALFANGASLQHAPEGTLARDEPQRMATAQRPALGDTLLRRGRERYDIACAPCHGLDGAGNGVVVSRGFPRPEDFRAPAQRLLDSRHVYDVITRGFGVMYPHADRVEPADRWAIAAYVQALQRLDP